VHAPGAVATRTVFTARAVFDGVGDAPRADHGVLVEGDRVVAVGALGALTAGDVPVEDLGDVTVVPGFVDAHTHVTVRPGEGDQHGQLARSAAWQTIRGVRNLRRMLRSGVTTAKIMTEHHDIDFEYRDAIARGEVAGPRLLVAGAGLSPPGGHGAGGGGVAGVADLRAAVRARAERGADHIKIFTTGGVSSTDSTLAQSNYSAEEIAAITDEAAQAGLRVSAHAHGGPGVDLAVANGVHSIEHGALLDAGNLAGMVRHGTWLVSTQTILFHPSGIEAGDAAVPQIMAKVEEARAYATAHASRVRDSGVRIAVGTDSMHGLLGHEMRWLVEHGWSPLEALLAATRHGGELIGDPTVGVLREGSRADFVVLRGDPFADITAVFDVASVFRNGLRVVDAGRVLGEDEGEMRS
jgi:imidazolonepropionase-like amidohydrolase